MNGLVQKRSSITSQMTDGFSTLLATHELENGVGDEVQALGGELGIDRERQYRRGGAFGFGQGTLFVSQRPEALLKVQGHRIVNLRTDVARSEASYESVAV